jgi:hypothetical protein
VGFGGSGGDNRLVRADAQPSFRRLTMVAAARATLLMLLFTFFPQARYLFNDHLLSPNTVELIEKIGAEFHSKTGMNVYVVATNDRVGRGVSLFDYIGKYEESLSKPYVVLLFAPNSKRIGLIPSDPGLKKLYDASEVKRYAIRIVSSVDSNSMRSKYDLAVVQAYSELSDEIAEKKGIHLENTVKNESGWLIKGVTWIVYVGSLLVFWVYFGRPIYRRMRYG